MWNIFRDIIVALGFVYIFAVLLQVLIWDKTWGAALKTPVQLIWNKARAAKAPLKNGWNKVKRWRSKSNTEEGERHYSPGITLGVIRSRIFFGVITFVVAFVVTALVYEFLLMGANPIYFGNTTIRNVLLAVGVGSLLFLMWMRNEKRNVPNNHVVSLKFIGSLINVHLSVGDHIIPVKDLFSTNKDNVVGEAVRNTLEQNSSNPGLVYVGDVTVHLGDESGEPKMKATASDNAVAKLRPTFNYRCINPLQRMHRNSPIKDLNEAAREVVRDLVGRLTTSRQVNNLPDTIAKLLDNGRAYYVRTRASNANSGVHGGDLVVDDVTGYVIIKVGGKEEDQTLKDEILREVLSKGQKPMLDAASADPESPDHTTIQVTDMYVAEKLNLALEENGFTLVGLPRIGEIEIPGRVTDAGAQAAAEVEERKSALNTAETARQVSEKLQTGGFSKEDAAWAGFIQENKGSGQVVLLPSKSGGKSGPGIIINTPNNT